jgi:hypothetical protein
MNWDLDLSTVVLAKATAKSSRHQAFSFMKDCAAKGLVAMRGEAIDKAPGYTNVVLRLDGK